MLLAEYREQQTQGDAPSVDEFVSLHPELAPQLRSRLKSDSAGQTHTANSGDAPTPADGTIIWDDSRNSAQIIDDQATRQFDSSSVSASRPGGTRHTHQSPDIGDVVGGYRLVSELGRGGMGVVYQAEQVTTGRRVAVKLLSSDLNRTDTTIERFLKEASLAASLSHPRSTFVYEAGREGEHFFTVMELMPGDTLNDLVKKEGPLPVAQAVDYLLDAVDGLEAAHNAGIVHRDVKPSNCFMTDDGRVKIGDFGLSKSLVADSSLTMTGMFLGTPQFAAPEQIRHQQIDERTDIFALGASLFYLLSGKAPFEGSAAAVIAQIVADKPPSVRSLRRDAPSSLGRVLDRAMQKEPKKRFQNMADFRAALTPFSSQSSFAAIGRRMAAFGVDFAMLFILSIFVIILMAGFLKPYVDDLDTILPFAPIAFVQLGLMVPYFAVCEGLWGRTFGKWLFGLRVIPDSGDRPGFVRALIRVMLLPGLSFIMVSIYRDVLVGEISPNILELDVRKILGQQIFFFIQMIATGLLCITMRRRNGYRGVHEWLSSTSVVQPAKMEVHDVISSLPVTLATVPSQLPSKVGPYRVTGELGERGGVAVFAARDESLDRSVWVYTSREASALSVSPNRSSIVRSMRPHWLQNGTDQDEGGRELHWFAVEAVVGAPLRSQVGAVAWSDGRRFVTETAAELAAATDDETLPSDLDESHLWLETAGGIKLIDHPWWGVAADVKSDVPREIVGSSAVKESNPTHPPAILLHQVIDRFCCGREAPGAVLDLSLESEQLFAEAANGGAAFGNAASKVVAAANRPWQMRWDDRLSILMVSIATEYLPLNAMSGLIGLVVGRYLDVSIYYRMLIALFVTMIPVWIMTLRFREGGIAFRLCAAELRCCDGHKPSLGRRLWRNTLAWSMVIAPSVLLFTWVSHIDTDTFDRNASGTGRAMWFMLMAVTCTSLIASFGAAGSLISKRRAPQDLLAGTYLVRK